MYYGASFLCCSRTWQRRFRPVDGFCLLALAPLNRAPRALAHSSPRRSAILECLSAPRALLGRPVSFRAASIASRWAFPRTPRSRRHSPLPLPGLHSGFQRTIRPGGVIVAAVVTSPALCSRRGWPFGRPNRLCPVRRWKSRHLSVGPEQLPLSRLALQLQSCRAQRQVTTFGFW